MRFLSFGGGVQTTSLLLMDQYDEIIFADTGNEMPETYDYMKRYIAPYVEMKGIKFTVVRKGVKQSETLEQFCLRRHKVPSFMHRWCTRDFKVIPIRRYIKKSNQYPAICVMGISFDEIARVRTDHPGEFTYEYPLVGKKLTREDCTQEILKQGWEVPPKSGCFFCPYNRVSRMRQIYETMPEHWQRIKTMEETAINCPRLTLSTTGKKISELEEYFKTNPSLDTFEPDTTCEAGHCMV